MDKTRMVALALFVGVAGLVGIDAATRPSAPTAPRKRAATPPKNKPKVDPDCPDGKCPPKKRPPRWGERLPAPVGAAREWRRFGESREYALLESGRQVGSYDAETGVYRALLADGWGPKQWLPAGVPPPEGDVRGGPVAPDGTEVQCEVPVEFRTRNIGSKVDGAGMCVTTSTSVAAKWSGCEPWVGIRDYAAQFPGGSYPPKHLKQLADYGAKHNLGDAPWAQYVGRDPAPFLDAVLGSGRVACVSWHNGGHWLNLVHLDAKNACIMDNNGDPQNLRWMTREAALREINSPYAWVGCWLPPGPPPPPHNANAPRAEAAPPAAGAAPQRMPAVSYCVAQGVFLDRLVGADELTIRGKSGTIEQLRAELGAGRGNRLTVIGTPEQAAAVAAGLGDLAGKVTMANYAPDSWQVRGMGFAAGSPAIYLQAADGTVLFRQESSADLTAIAERIRKADPDYRPEDDPTPQSPAGPAGDAAPILLLAAAGVAGAGWKLFRR